VYLPKCLKKFSYQAVIRDNSNILVINTEVGIQISILQGSEIGTAIYSEQHDALTNANGLVSIAIGLGTTIDNFESINWANGPYFVKTEIDPTGGEDYTITGTSQLLSVPYATHVKTAENGLMNGITPGEMQFWNGTAWVSVSSGFDGATLTLENGIPTWVGAYSVSNPNTEQIWMDRNLGATQVATSSTCEPAYGDLYQWGRAADGHQIRTSATTDVLSSSDTPEHGNFIITNESSFDWLTSQNDNLWQGVNGINNPCPSGYRLPTSAEWQAERETWSSDDPAGAFASTLKLPLAGSRTYETDFIILPGVSGKYWSSTTYNTDSYSLFINTNSGANITPYYRAYGCSVRCIKN